MRKLERPESPPCLAEAAPGWTAEFVAARQRDAGYRFSWRSQACYQVIRGRLSEMTQSHCAFCDGSTGLESRETVEHFRPKSQFPELAYVWHNLFPCCDRCQSLKREQFDELLLKPDEVGYRFENHFLLNYKTGELAPLPHVDVERQRCAEITIRMYGLNLPERMKARLRERRAFDSDPDPCLDDYNYRFFLE